MHGWCHHNIFHFCHINKQMWCCCGSQYSNRSQKTSKCGQNINDTLSCANFLFLSYFDDICDLHVSLHSSMTMWNLLVINNCSGCRETVRLSKCHAQDHNKIIWPGLQPRPLNPESRALTDKPLDLPLFLYFAKGFTDIWCDSDLIEELVDRYGLNGKNWEEKQHYCHFL